MTAAKYKTIVHLEQLGKLIKQAEKYKSMVDRKKFLTDQMSQDAISRNLQQILEAMITIGEMIIAENGFRKPAEHNEVFDILGENKVYPKSFSDQLWKIGGFRNILVHDYVSLDLDLVYDNLEKGIPIFRKYARYVAKFIEK